MLGTDGIPFGDVRLAVPSNFAETLAQINLDHLPNEANQFRYRFSLQRTREEQAGSGSARFNNLSAYDTRLFSATWVRTFGASLVNDMRLSYRRVNENYPVKEAAANVFPNIVVTSANFGIGPNQLLPQGTPVNNNYGIYDALTYIRGNHNFKFGGEARRLITSVYFLQNSRGYYDYSDLDQLLRDEAPATNLRGAGNSSFAANNSRFAGFAQDDWKIMPSLTLNLGVRYEYTSAL